MPRIRMRPAFWLSSLILAYHWVFGLPGVALELTNYLRVAQTPLQAIEIPTILPGYNISQPYKKRIIAIGDLHGDLAHTLRVLRTAGIVDHRAHWIGKTATLIQTGDIVDRGKDTIALYRLFDNLRTEAANVGGELISLMGNHEYMNIMGDWRYVTKEDVGTFHGEEARRKAFSTGWIGQTFAHNYSATARVGYAPRFRNGLDGATSHASVLAVHGGLHPDWTNLERTNQIGHSLVDRLVNAKQPSRDMLPPDTPQEERDFIASTGPVWYRGYALDSEDGGICEQAEAVLQATNSTRMIMGHTPQFTSILSRCRSKVIVIDTGISSAYGGVLSALEIVYSLNPVLPDTSQSKPNKWSWSKRPELPKKLIERETVTALYMDRTEVIAKKERTIDVPE